MNKRKSRAIEINKVHIWIVERIEMQLGFSFFSLLQLSFFICQRSISDSSRLKVQRWQHFCIKARSFVHKKKPHTSYQMDSDHLNIAHQDIHRIQWLMQSCNWIKASANSFEFVHRPFASLFIQTKRFY